MLPQNIYQQRNILSLKINAIGYQSALNYIVELAQKKRPSYICFANVHMAIEAHWDPEFASAVNAATLIVTDGVPLAKAFKWLYNLNQDRIAGMDAFPDLLKIAAGKHLSVFFFGSTHEQLSKIKDRLAVEYPQIRIAGLLSPTFNGDLNNEAYLNQIRESQPDLVFVALGCPKQERWMAQNSTYIDAPLLGVGGAFAVFNGTKSRAPYWMQKYSLEWLYRLVAEPKRMWRRYFITNSLFIYLISKQLLSRYIK